MCGGAAVVRRRSNGGSVVEQGRFLLSLQACLCVFEDNDTKRQARLCEKYHKESYRMFWNQVEKKREVLESSGK